MKGEGYGYGIETLSIHRDKTETETQTQTERETEKKTKTKKKTKDEESACRRGFGGIKPEGGATLAPLLMKPDEVLTLQQAAHRARRSVDTVKRLCSRYGISRRSGGQSRVDVSAVGLEMVLHDDMAALELLRAGKREQLEVRRYFDHLGLQP